MEISDSLAEELKFAVAAEGACEPDDVGTDRSTKDTGSVTSYDDSVTTCEHPRMEEKCDLIAIETCASDIHRLDYRCYIMPLMESIEAGTEDGTPIKLTKEVRNEHVDVCS